jgi:hypothetical protein
MARLSPDAAAAKWSTNLGASTAGIQAQVQAVTEAPGVAAARQKTLWLQRVTASADKWARRVSAVSLQDWQSAMINKGIPRIASGASAAVPKMTSFFQDFLPYVDQGVAAIKNMPKGGVEQGIARASAMIRHNAAYVRKS